MKKIPVLDLFSGVGAYSLGLERSGGFETVAFCEIDPYARRILKRHWPHVPIYEDVVSLTGDRLRADGVVPRWIVAGWPCQDVSVAGTGDGLDGERSGLFEHIARLASEIGADGLILENSSNLLAINGGADFGEVLRVLASLGFDVVWHCLSAAAFDAPHIRDRLWIVAMASDANRAGRKERRGTKSVRSKQPATEYVGEALPNADCLSQIGPAIARAERHTWQLEPGVGRVASGVANRVDRIRCLGNLNPPIVPETIGRAIREAMS